MLVHQTDSNVQARQLSPEGSSSFLAASGREETSRELRFGCALDSDRSELAAAVYVHWLEHNVNIRFSSAGIGEWRQQGVNLITLGSVPDFAKLLPLRDSWVVVPARLDLEPSQVPAELYERRSHNVWWFEQNGQRLGGAPDHVMVPADLRPAMEKLASQDPGGAYREADSRRPGLGGTALAAAMPRQRLAS